MTIKELLQEIVLSNGTTPAFENVGISFLATVTEVDAKKYSCSVKTVGSDAELENVRLKAEFNKEYGVVYIPKKGSFVVVTVIASSGGAYVSLCSEVSKVEIIVDKLKCVIENNTISVENDKYSLKKAFDDIFTALSKLTVTTGVGPSGTPINIVEFQAVQQKLSNLLI